MSEAMIVGGTIPNTMVVKAELTLSDGRVVVMDQMREYSGTICHCIEDVSTIEVQLVANYTKEMDDIF